MPPITVMYALLFSLLYIGFAESQTEKRKICREPFGEKAGVEVEFQLLKKGFAVVFYRPNDNFLTTEEMSNVVRNVQCRKKCRKK
jgi:hypothetical protein